MLFLNDALLERQRMSTSKAMSTLTKIDNPLGCHETFNCHYHKQNSDIAFLMIWFNHSSVEVTKRYIGIDLDERVKKIRKFEI